VCQSISARGAERLATGLRAFLGFALVEGIIAKQLASAVLSAARWSGVSLPRGLAPGQVAALLASCDQSQATGRRDSAILVTLVRLGLRAAEVAGLRLDHIDWRAGEIVIRGKGGTEERLPLPPDVGRAIVAYLRHARPQRLDRELFLRAAAPLRGLTPDGVSEVVRAASERAGLGSFGSHRLRHTAGTARLNVGHAHPPSPGMIRTEAIALTRGWTGGWRRRWWPNPSGGRKVGFGISRRRHPERVLIEFIKDYHEARPHQGLRHRRPMNWPA
jgi:integrase/recombinase XerD